MKTENRSDWCCLPTEPTPELIAKVCNHGVWSEQEVRNLYSDIVAAAHTLEPVAVKRHDANCHMVGPSDGGRVWIEELTDIPVGTKLYTSPMSQSRIPMDIYHTLLDTPKAHYTFSIVADTGYESTTEGTCSVQQYSDVMAVLHGDSGQPLTRDRVKELVRRVTGHPAGDSLIGHEQLLQFALLVQRETGGRS